MAPSADPPASPPRLSLWRRLSKRETSPKIPSSDLTRKSSTAAAMDSNKPTKLRRRQAHVYKDAPDDSPIQKASLHLPLSPPASASPSPSVSPINETPPQLTPQQSPPETPQLSPDEDPQEAAEKKKKQETISILQVQRIRVPVTRMKPRVVSMNRVLPTDMQITPFPDSPNIRTVSWNVFLRPEQVYSLVMGFFPDRVDDKWFVYSQGPDKTGKLKVHFHRSWTGMKIAELFVVVDLKGEGAGTVVGVKWNGSSQTNAMEEDEAKYMVSTTCSWVLGVNLENGLFPAMQFE